MELNLEGTVELNLEEPVELNPAEPCGTEPRGTLWNLEEPSGTQFMFQEPPLTVEAAAVSRQTPVRSDDPVAWDDDGDGVCAVGCADGADSRWGRNRSSNLRVGGRRAGPDGPERVPYALLERRAVQLDVNRVDRVEPSGEVLAETGGGPCRVGMRLDRFGRIPSLQRPPHARIVLSEMEEADKVVARRQRQ